MSGAIHATILLESMGARSASLAIECQQTPAGRLSCSSLLSFHPTAYSHSCRFLCSSLLTCFSLTTLPMTRLSLLSSTVICPCRIVLPAIDRRVAPTATLLPPSLSVSPPFVPSHDSRWETIYDPVPVRDWMMRHPIVPLTACVLYGLMIVIGQALFAKRERLRWKYTLAAWNLALATFSAVGFCRTAPWLWHMVQTYSWDQILCFDPEASFGSGSTGLWVQLFVLSKFPYV
jgi:hypothetical protein